jgi:hypothetical protein
MVIMPKYYKRKKLGMMRKLFIIFILLPLISFGQKEVFTNSFISLDNESQLNIRTYQGYRTDLDSLFKKDSVFIKRKTNVGISNGIRYYRTNPNEPTYFFNEAKIYIKTKPIERLTVIFNPSLLMSKEFSNFTYEFNTSYQYKKWYFEASSERDLVGARAIEMDLVSNYYGLSVDYSPTKQLTLVGGVQYNYITDYNNRWFYTSRIIYTLPNEKIYFDFKTRNMEGGEWSPYYFSPEDISQKQIGFGINQPLLNDKILFKTYIGGGLQTIDKESMYLLTADFKVTTQLLKRLNSETSLGFRNFNKYIYSFGNLKLSYSF